MAAILSDFLDKQFLLDYLKVSQDSVYDMLEPHLSDALEKYIYPMLGQKFTQQIISGSFEDENVKTYVKEAIINFGGELFLNHGTLNITGTGLMENQTTDLKPARFEAISISQQARAEMGYMKLDLLFDYLETALEEDPDKFPDYTSSPDYKEIKKLPITKTSDFQKWVNIRKSRCIFLNLIPAMNQAMINDLEPVLNLKSQATITPNEELILKSLTQNALANLAFSYGVMDLATTFGFEMILSFSNLNAARQKGYQELALDKIEQIESKKHAAGIAALNKLKDFIEQRIPGNTPNFQEAEIYQNNTESRVFYTGGLIGFVR